MSQDLKSKILLPRGYISHSARVLWESSRAKFRARYYFGEEGFQGTKEMKYGKMFADAMENESDDILLSAVSSLIPRYKEIEFEIRIEFNGIMFLGRLDTFDDKCPDCNWQDNMVRLNNEKQQRTIYQRTQSFESVGGKIKNSKQGKTLLVQGNKGSNKVLVQGNERSDETKQNEFQKRTSGMEQGQKVFGNSKKEYEYIENRNKTSTIHKRTQRKNRQSELEGKDRRTHKDKKQNGISGMAGKSFQEGQMDLPELRTSGRKIERRPHKTILPLSKTTTESKQRENTLSKLPQKNSDIRGQVCNLCKGEPYLRFREFKTGKQNWTQAKVDSDDQITTYCMLVYLKYKKIPKEVYLDWIETEEVNGQIAATGQIKSFKTTRTLTQILRMANRFQKAARSISEDYQSEFLNRGPKNTFNNEHRKNSKVARRTGKRTGLQTGRGIGIGKRTGRARHIVYPES